MTFELDVSNATQVSGNSGGGSTVDWEALNQHVVDVVGTQTKAKSVVGFISGLYDLGMQPRPDFEKIHDPSKKEEVEALEKGEARLEKKNFYDNGTWHNDVDVFCKPRTPAKAIALAVDFPQFQVDKGQFFGESNPAALRLIMGGTWSVVNPDNTERKMPVVATPFYLAENTNNNANEWAISNRTNLFKMGEAADLLNENGNFKKESVSQLLGKALLFKIQVFMKPDKFDKKKSYYTEYIKFVSEVPDGLPVPEFDTSLIHGLNMNRPNDPEALKQVRSTIKNTMRLSTDWEGSVIKGELEALYQERQQSNTQQQSEEEKPSEKAPEPPVEDFEDDEDIPF